MNSPPSVFTNAPSIHERPSQSFFSSSFSARSKLCRNSVLAKSCSERARLAQSYSRPSIVLFYSRRFPHLRRHAPFSVASYQVAQSIRRLVNSLVTDGRAKKKKKKRLVEQPPAPIDNRPSMSGVADTTSQDPILTRLPAPRSWSAHLSANPNRSMHLIRTAIDRRVSVVAPVDLNTGDEACPAASIDLSSSSQSQRPAPTAARTFYSTPLPKHPSTPWRAFFWRRSSKFQSTAFEMISLSGQGLAPTDPGV
ncbi:hypothetical protein C8F01DRAFT_1275680 [Mycena amicta]|nr:hypothetical protein C8F01DRAFT_1275680 [Mycena amicta]